MTDRTSGPGGDRHRAERLSGAPAEEWVPEQESADRDEWAPGDAAPRHRAPRTPRPEERLPGEPAARMPGEGAGGRVPGGAEGRGEGTGSRLSGADMSGRAPAEGVSGRAPGEGAGGRSADEGVSGRLPGAAGPGREGLTGDDRTPQDTPQPPPGPAGVPESGLPGGHGVPGEGKWPPGPAGTPASGLSEGPAEPGAERAGRPHGTEGLRPGTEELGPETPGAEHMRPESSGADTGRSSRTGAGGREATEEEGQMPDDGLGAPAVGAASGREAGTTEGRGADTWPTAPGSPPASGGSGPGTVGATATAPSGTGAPLLPHEETDRWEQRLREVTGRFVDDPREAVEQADRTVEEIARRFTEAVTRRRRTLRMSWEGTEARGPAAETDTEQLRLALRDYRELAGRLLHG
ncbi:hypothetical protein ACWDUC_23165 [Streptomyces tricolor]